MSSIARSTSWYVPVESLPALRLDDAGKEVPDRGPGSKPRSFEAPRDA